MKKEDYSKKLRDPRWQKKRLKTFERDEWTCQMCGAEDKTLHAHHKYYVIGREPWDCDDYSLITLCKDCHKDEKLEASKACTLLANVARINFLSNKINDLAKHLRYLSRGDRPKNTIVDIIGALMRDEKFFNKVVKLHEKNK